MGQHLTQPLRPNQAPKAPASIHIDHDCHGVNVLDSVPSEPSGSDTEPVDTSSTESAGEWFGCNYFPPTLLGSILTHLPSAPVQVKDHHGDSHPSGGSGPSGSGAQPPKSKLIPGLRRAGRKMDGVHDPSHSLGPRDHGGQQRTSIQRHR